MAKLRAFSDQATPVFARVPRRRAGDRPRDQGARPVRRRDGAVADQPGHRGRAEQAAAPRLRSDPARRRRPDGIGGARRQAPRATCSPTSAETGFHEQFMSLLFNTTGAINGYDQYGHFLRAWLIPNNACTAAQLTPANRVPAPRTSATAATGHGERGSRSDEGSSQALSVGAPCEVGPGGVPGGLRQPPSPSSGAGLVRPFALARRRARPARHDDRQAAAGDRRRPVTRRRAGVIASSPVLVGAITTLIVILAVFLAYNANNGLPVRAHLQALGPGAEREHARQGQRRAHRRSAGRHRGEDRAGSGRRRPARFTPRST